MFGHDDHNNNDDNGQITLPPASTFTPDDNGNTDHQEGGDNNFGETPRPEHRSPAKSGAPTDSLLDIKQQALQALTPLVGHLEQTPEEKFRTTMMMIQASDDHGLISVAYEAAQQIANEKERAQALLDIVNEINYFTQNQPAA